MLAHAYNFSELETGKEYEDRLVTIATDQKQGVGRWIQPIKDWISAISSLIAAFGIVFAALQILLAREQIRKDHERS